jgi:poly-gamma-glutamate synthesis protein (capsule biosynthesis protein)
MSSSWLFALLAAAALGCTPTTSGSVELWIGGDVHVGNAPVSLPQLAELGDALGIINLEGPVSDGVREGLANSPSSLPALHAAGVRVAGIANNHADDAGIDGRAVTRAALSAHGISPTPSVLTLGFGEQRIAVTAHDLTAGVPAALSDELHAARAQGDVLVSTFHVTGPPSYLPRPELRDAVEVALDAGALVVAAHGTHALARVERRGRAVIAWGLGNLLFECDCTDDSDGAILRVSIESGAVRASIVPIDAGLRGAAARPAHDPELIFDLLDALGSTPLLRETSFARF